MHKGQILLELDDQVLQAQLRQTQASVQSAAATLELAVANEQRILNLFDQEFVSRQEMDSAVQARKAAAAHGWEATREHILVGEHAVIADTDEEALALANDTKYGLAAYVQTQDWDKARRIARRLRAGSVYLNGVGQEYPSPFGGFKQSGNGREWGKYGLLDFTEFKVINGFHEA